MSQKIEGFQIGEVSRIWTPDLQFQNLIDQICEATCKTENTDSKIRTTNASG